MNEGEKIVCIIQVKGKKGRVYSYNKIACRNPLNKISFSQGEPILTVR